MIHQLVIEYIWDVFKTFQGENVCTSEINIIIALVIIPKKKSSFTLERVFKRIWYSSSLIWSGGAIFSRRISYKNDSSQHKMSL